jgi:hypothetical protein
MSRKVNWHSKMQNPWKNPAGKPETETETLERRKRQEEALIRYEEAKSKMRTITKEQKISKVAKEVKVGDMMQTSVYSFNEVVDVKRVDKIVCIKTANGVEFELEDWMRVVVKITYTITI